MNRSSKLGRKAPAGTPTGKPGAKPEPAISRNPLKELNHGYPPAAHARKGSRGGCFGFLLPNSSASSSSSVSPTASSSMGSLPRSRSLPRTPRSAPQSSRTPRPLDALGDPPALRSRATHRQMSRDGGSSFENLKQSRSDEQQKPENGGNRQWRGRGGAGSEGRPLQEAAEERRRRAAVGELSHGFDLGERGAFLGELSRGSVLDATPGKEGERQQQQPPSHTPASTTTATPPVQASISPELSVQSALPSPACFAAGHLIAGVQDRRKCRPRGILNGGGCGVEIADGRGLGSLDAPGSGCCRISTPPPPMEASVQWLSSPCDDGSGRFGLSAAASSHKKVYLGFCPAEASVSRFLSPLDDAADVRVLGDFPSAVTEATGNSPEFGSLVDTNSSNFENTPSAVEICCSPTTNSSVSPFSMIIQKAAGSARCKDHSLQGKGRYRYGSSGGNSTFSGVSHGGSNVICTPSSCSCSSRRVGPPSTFDLQAMGGDVETLSSSSPLWKLLASESEDLLSFSAPRFQSEGSSTPSNSIRLACFRRPSRHQNSVKEERLSSSELRISWREGLISRIFEMDEFDHNPWSSNKENVDCHGEDKLSLKPDTKLDQNLERSLIKEANDQFTTNGFGSFQFVGHKQIEEQSEAKSSSPIPISCAESLSIEVDGLAASDDSDWTLFFKNHLFEV